MDISVPQNAEFFRIFDVKIDTSNKSTPLKHVREASLSYNENYLLEEPQTDFTGWFQSECYLPFTRQTVGNYFSIKIPLVQKLESYFSLNGIKRGDFTSVHIRRGDYSNSNGFYAYPDMSYYLNASKHIGNEKLVLFSDGILTESELSYFKEFNYLVCNLTAEESFVAMTMSSSIVLSASTFSWWASYLSESNQNICPSDWYGPNGPTDKNHIYSSHIKRWLPSLN